MSFGSVDVNLEQESISRLEQLKFASESGQVVVRTKILGGLLNGISYDYLSAAYPNATTEVYTYKTGGFGGTTVATVTVVYVASNKKEILSVTRS